MTEVVSPMTSSRYFGPGLEIPNTIPISPSTSVSQVLTPVVSFSSNPSGSSTNTVSVGTRAVPIFSSPPIVEIAGGVAGGLAFLGIVLAMGYLLLCRRRSHTFSPLSDPEARTTTLNQAPKSPTSASLSIQRTWDFKPNRRQQMGEWNDLPHINDTESVYSNVALRSDHGA